MAIFLKPVSNHHELLFVCDGCGEEIKNERQASYAYWRNEILTVDIYYLHDDCIDNFAVTHKPLLLPPSIRKATSLRTVPLRAFPVYMMNVLGINLKEAKLTAKALSL